MSGPILDETLERLEASIQDLRLQFKSKKDLRLQFKSDLTSDVRLQRLEASIQVRSQIKEMPDFKKMETIWEVKGSGLSSNFIPTFVGSSGRAATARPS